MTLALNKPQRLICHYKRMGIGVTLCEKNLRKLISIQKAKRKPTLTLTEVKTEKRGTFITCGQLDESNIQ